jgi:hypothetical protein
MLRGVGVPPRASEGQGELSAQGVAPPCVQFLARTRLTGGESMTIHRRDLQQIRFNPLGMKALTDKAGSIRQTRTDGSTCCTEGLRGTIHNAPVDRCKKVWE